MNHVQNSSGYGTVQLAAEKGAFTQESQKVIGMFSAIAHRYDLTNSVLSFGIHHWWRRVLLKKAPSRRDIIALDLCTGTGDLLPILSRRYSQVVGADFCRPMLDVADKKYGSHKGISLCQADALDLPFADNSFGVVTVSFGVRNFESLQKGLREIQRVLAPGGRLLVLEFGQPKGLFGFVYRWYSKVIMPWIGGVLTGNRTAYEYLPATAKAFPCGRKFEAELQAAGLMPVRTSALTFGIAYAYAADKSRG
jgi:demethylmenaquinone methyltransferase / 2-methoxy-6-polyprenyl-1,4-benzoquinol methylase